MGKAICVIPARGGSKRIPKKNIAKLCGRTLIDYAVQAALASKVFNKVVVSTDDPEIAEEAQKNGSSILLRNSSLATDKSTVVQVCLDALDKLETAGERFDIIAILLPTSPLRTSDDIKKAFRLLGDADGVMAVTSFAIPPFWALKESDGLLKPIWPEYMIRSQDLPKTCVDNGAIYIVRTEALRKEKTVYLSRLIPYHMPRERSIDIDEPIDLDMAEFFMVRKKCS